MHDFISAHFGWFLHIGAFGLVLLGVMDSSFLFLPFGNDILLVFLTARNHGHLPLYVLAASVGSTLGVVMLDFVCRKGGEGGLKRMMSPRRFEYLKRKMSKSAAIPIVVTCLAPPPFPFTAVIAAASAFQYPRPKLLGYVFGARVVRFILIGLAAIYFGARILRIADSPEFTWFMVAFAALCIGGSALSIVRWIRLGRTQ